MNYLSHTYNLYPSLFLQNTAYHILFLIKSLIPKSKNTTIYKVYNTKSTKFIE